MDVVGFSEDDLDHLFSILSAILHLSNVHFDTVSDHAELSQRTSLDFAADLLQVNCFYPILCMPSEQVIEDSADFKMCIQYLF